MIFWVFIVIAVLVVAGAIVRGLVARKRGYGERFYNARIAYALIMVGAIFGYFDASELNELRSRRNWPTAAGEVIESKITGEKAIVPSVTYTYALGDKAYTSTSDLGTPGFGNAAKRLNAAQTLIADYPVGRAVRVHYNPDDPRESYLTTAVPWNAYMRYGLWICALLFGLLIQHFFGFKRRSEA